MKKYIIMLSSITYAYRARDILLENHIKCYVERIPHELRGNGCGYGVSVTGDAESARQLLISRGLRVKDIITI